MRIANIIEDGRIAGPQLRIVAVASQLKKLGVETVVMFPKADSQVFASRLNEEGIRCIVIPLSRLSKELRSIVKYIIFFPFEIYLLWQQLRKGGFSYVHCSGGFWQVKGLLAAKLAGVPALWHINDTVFPVRFRFFFLLICKYFVYKLIFAGRRVREHYLAATASPVNFVEIQAPVNTGVFDPNLAAENASISDVNGIRIVMVANVNPLKGVESFIEMAANLNHQFIGLNFFVVGPIYKSQNSYYKKLISLVHELGINNLFFLGACEDIPGILKAADIYVCTSIAEASPTSIWEAMSMKKAIVSTDVGDASRFITDGISGFIVPIGDIAALSSAVTRFISSSELRVKCGVAARHIAIEQLDITVCVKWHMKAYS